jgi:hypothetical protein
VRRGVALAGECHNAQVLRDRAGGGGYLLFHWPRAVGHWLARSASAGGPFAALNMSAVPSCPRDSDAQKRFLEPKKYHIYTKSQ